MIPIEYVIAIALSITNILKKKVPKEIVPLMGIAVAMLLNSVNALAYGECVGEACKEGLIVMGITSGLFTAGDMTNKLTVSKKKNIR